VVKRGADEAGRVIIYVITRMILGGAQETAKFTAEHFYNRGDRVLFVIGPETGREGELKAKVPTLVLPTLVRRISPANDLRALWTLFRLFRREKPDIVHSRTAKARFLASLAARIARVNCVIQTIHGFSFNNEVESHRLLYVRMERLLARLCHCSIVVSEADIEEGRDLQILKQDRTTLIRSGADTARLQHPDPLSTARIRAYYAPSCERIVTLVGRLSSPKTPDVFVDASALVLRTHPSTKFLLVGDGKKRESLQSQITRLGIQDHVALLGVRSDVSEIMAASDIVVHSSTHEGMPKTVLEGMAAGKPVIATAVGGVPVVIRNEVSGLLVSPRKAHELANAIEKLLDDGELRARLASTAAQRVEEFSLERTVKETEALYDRLTLSRTSEIRPLILN
jgi:glycosyltransferase involved in cell wall biosynthesis